MNFLSLCEPFFHRKNCPWSLSGLAKTSTISKHDYSAGKKAPRVLNNNTTKNCERLYHKNSTGT